jgi:hypothetical protein
MPHELELDGPLAKEVMKRVINEPPKRKMDLGSTTSPSQTTLNPTVAAILGAVADGASTYNMLKRGSMVEDNAMFSGIGSPAATGLAAAGTGLAVPLLARLLKGKLPKGIIDPIVANMGARTLGVAGSNFDGGGVSSFDQLNNAITRNVTGQDK